jgi:hypothetical protein
MTSVICDTWSSNVFHMFQKTWIRRHNNDSSLQPHNLAPQGTCFMGGGGWTKQQVWSTVKSTWGKQQLPPTTRVNRPPAKLSARTTYLALLHALQMGSRLAAAVALSSSVPQPRHKLPLSVLRPHCHLSLFARVRLQDPPRWTKILEQVPPPPPPPPLKTLFNIFSVFFSVCKNNIVIASYISFSLQALRYGSKTRSRCQFWFWIVSSPLCVDRLMVR